MIPTTTRPPKRSHEKPAHTLASRARRASRNVLLLAVAVKLLDVGTTTLTHDAWAGLAQIVVGAGCLVAYELTD